MNLNPIAAHGTPEWFAARRGRITASMAASILCPGQPGTWGNPLTAYLELTAPDKASEDEDGPDDDEEEDISPSDAADYGRETQEVHAHMLAKRAGVKWAALEPGFYVHPTIPWLGASPDAIGSLDGAPCSGEFKAPTNLQIVKQLRHGIPLPYVAQSMVQMVVLDVPQSIVSVLFPPAPTWQRIHRSPELEAWVMNGLRAFWEEHVVAGIPPETNAAWLDERAVRALNDLYPSKKGTAVYWSLEDEGTSVAQALEEAKEAKKRAEEMEKIAKARLIELSQGAEMIYLPDGSGYSRTTSVRSMKATEARTIEVTTLRRVKAK